MWKFPFKRDRTSPTNDSESFSRVDMSHLTEIPLQGHIGGFLAVRKHHTHKGIDLYAPHGENVYAVESGQLILITIFTGEKVGSPWWHETQALMVLGKTGCVVYGEIQPRDGLKVGQPIQKGEFLGTVTSVLKRDKGRPMSMLHLELYERPEGDVIHFRDTRYIKDPTQHLINAELWGEQ